MTTLASNKNGVNGNNDETISPFLILCSMYVRDFRRLFLFPKGIGSMYCSQDLFFVNKEKIEKFIIYWNGVCSK